MIRGLPVQPFPHWLVDAAMPLGDLKLHELLRESVFYPASGVDGRPVQWLVGNFWSFVCVDFGVTSKRILDGLKGKYEGFPGYHPIACRRFGSREIPSRDRMIANPPADSNWPRELRIRTPFAIWAIMERMPTPEFGPGHGPDRFSLLYIGSDARTSFEILYTANSIAPAVVSIIGWAEFENPLCLLAQTVLLNPAGAPQYLLHGGGGQTEWYDRPCWPSYTERLWQLLDGDEQFRLWRRPRPATV